jgi:hypothetical protein
MICACGIESEACEYHRIGNVEVPRAEGQYTTVPSDVRHITLPPAPKGKRWVIRLEKAP